ncbi:efflux RND transporter periplasmic adaptor subunit [Candidatus Microgenomates bacterium]|nr:efflux RND transporter periplasmic adaptor subunit [Candidatus Microgenomates bacterium]
MKNIFQLFKKWPKKFLVIGLFVTLAIIGFSFYSLRGIEKPAEIASVKRGDLVVEVSAAGTLTGQKLIPLRFQTSGEITQVNVKEGDKVYKGQILANLDNREQLIALQQAQNTLRDKQATVDKVLDDIHLFQYGMGGFANIGTENETMTQRQLRTTAEVARDNAYDAVKLAQKVLEDTLILAPTAGIVTEVNFIPGQNVSIQDIIVTIVDTSKIYFNAEVDEADIGKISLGQKANITLDTYPGQVFEGAIDKIIPQTITNTTGATVVIVKIKLNNPPEKFVNDLSGQASIEITKAEDTLIISIEALQNDNSVFIQTSQGPEKRTVKVGIQTDTEVEIKQGISEENQVILNP